MKELPKVICALLGIPLILLGALCAFLHVMFAAGYKGMHDWFLDW